MVIRFVTMVIYFVTMVLFYGTILICFKDLIIRILGCALFLFRCKFRRPTYFYLGLLPCYLEIWDVSLLEIERKVVI